MPLYEYKCRACGAVVEVMQSVRDPPKRRCAACGGRLEKLISRTGFILKGGGWYADGYSRAAKSEGGGESEAGAPSAAPSGGEAAAGGKADSKPAEGAVARDAASDTPSAPVPAPTRSRRAGPRPKGGSRKGSAPA